MFISVLTVDDSLTTVFLPTFTERYTKKQSTHTFAGSVGRDSTSRPVCSNTCIVTQEKSHISVNIARKGLVGSRLSISTRKVASWPRDLVRRRGKIVTWSQVRIRIRGKVASWPRVWVSKRRRELILAT